MWDVPEKSVKFYVSIPFWRTWWFFLTLFSGFIMLMMYLINLNRIHQLKHIQSIRNKISKDLHDDIGSTLSSISINSTAAGKMKEEQYEETQTILFYIGESSRSAMENMSDIVWAINPSNDTFKNMIDRLAAFGYRILEARNIKLIIDIPESVQALKLDMQMRKNIYLILREAIHNAAKYSQATHCLLTAMVLDKKIDIQVSDDGIGFDTLIPRPGGNGLTNMKHRAVEINAELSIHSEKENGTRLSLQFNYQ